jgi:hypothetical protein
MSLSQGLKICLWLSGTVPNAEPKGLGPNILKLKFGPMH